MEVNGRRRLGPADVRLCLASIVCARCPYPWLDPPFGDVAIRHVLPVLCMTSRLYIVASNRRRTSDSVRSSMDLSLWHILNLIDQGGTGPGAESAVYDCRVCCKVV